MSISSSHRRLLTFVIAIFLGTVPRVYAECIIIGAKQILENPSHELVFGGRVIDVHRTAPLAYRATFEVDRVWKGTVPKKVDLYVWELSPEHPRFEKDHRYIAIAQKLTDPKVRKEVGITNDSVAFAPVSCSDALAPDVVSGLGAGHRPD